MRILLKVVTITGSFSEKCTSYQHMTPTTTRVTAVMALAVNPTPTPPVHLCLFHVFMGVKVLVYVAIELYD